MKIPGTGILHPIVRRVQKKLATSKGLILMYHRVAEAELDPWSLCVTPQNFAEQLAVLREHYHPLTLQQLVQVHQAQNIPDRTVVITFDDGYADNLHQAKPILERYDMPATVFVITGHLGNSRGFWWDTLAQVLLRPGKLPRRLVLTIDGFAEEGSRTRYWELGDAADYSQTDYQADRTIKAHEAKPGSRLFFYYSIWQTLLPLPEPERQSALEQILRWAGADSMTLPNRHALTPKEVSDLGQGDLLEIGAHTVTHPLLSAQDLAVQRDEIQQSKADLETILNRSVTSFSYPFGNRTAETVALTQAAGFNCACSTVEEIVWQHSDRFQLPRFAVQNWNGQDFSD
ncbi:MAG: polysaccharide deacetylase family protein, partial [Cyanobacteria bacterium P01_F01_bin.4]